MNQTERRPKRPLDQMNFTPNLSENWTSHWWSCVYYLWQFAGDWSTRNATISIEALTKVSITSLWNICPLAYWACWSRCWRDCQKRRSYPPWNRGLVLSPRTWFSAASAMSVEIVGCTRGMSSTSRSPQWPLTCYTLVIANLPILWIIQASLYCWRALALSDEL